MAVDVFEEEMSDQQLIEKYEQICELLMNDNNHQLDLFEICIASAMSKRKLNHYSKFKFGFPCRNNNYYMED